ncbi:MAG: redox-sensitive transcriptional activator SoxR [Actinomycetes bacterium]|jgi:MerR family redox-sensitive transcriptional activator SoxR
MDSTDLLTIGELAARAGVATSALRFYEEKGLISSERTDGNQRRYRRATIRRVSVIKAAQRCGLTLDEIAEVLDQLPSGVARQKDWEKVSRAWKDQLEERIRRLELLRDQLDSCIGCGCLSMNRCGLLNPQDAAASTGVGPRYLEPDGPRPGSLRRGIEGSA